MRYHAKKSLVLMITTVIMAAIIAYVMATNYPEDGLFVAEIGPYYSFYLLLLIGGILLNRLVVSGLFRLIHYKEKENTPWEKSDRDIIVEHQGVLNVFVIGLVGLAIALGALYFNQPLPWFFILLFLVILGAELTLLASVFIYNRNLDKKD